MYHKLANNLILDQNKFNLETLICTCSSFSYKFNINKFKKIWKKKRNEFQNSNKQVLFKFHFIFIQIM